MTEPLTPEQLAELRRLCEAVPPDPWQTVSLSGLDGPYTIRMPYRMQNGEWAWHYGISRIVFEPVAEFVVTAREALPALLDEVERLQQQLATLRNAECVACGRALPPDGDCAEAAALRAAR